MTASPFVGAYPVEYLSYSKIRTYLNSKIAFWRHYITRTATHPVSATMVEGSILHEMIEWIVKDSIKQGKRLMILPPESEIIAFLEPIIEDEFPKITRQTTVNLTPQILNKHALLVAEEFVRNINAWLSEDESRRFTHAEYVMNTFIRDNKGRSFDIPFTSIIDAVSTERDEKGETITRLWDWKMVRTLSDATVEKNMFLYQMQRILYTLVAREEFTTGSIRSSYGFFKTSKSRKDKEGNLMTPQSVLLHMEEPETYDLQSFCFLIDCLLRDMQGLQSIREGEPMILPNPYDMMDGEENWKGFQEYYHDEIISI